MMMMVVVFIAVPLIVMARCTAARHRCNNTAIAAGRAAAAGCATGKNRCDVLYWELTGLSRRAITRGAAPAVRQGDFFLCAKCAERS
jgi:hypothetical protein